MMKVKARRKQELRTPYDAGYDCGYFGADTKNCHFAWFSTPENTPSWELGKRNGEAARKADEANGL